MISVRTGIYPENWSDFETFCKKTNSEISYKQNMGNYISVDVSMDGSSVDEFDRLHNKWIAEHKTWWQKLFNW